uniref:Macaca fascicularis brain cDNA clone: QmoA-10266, similar to human DEAD (Asp-Glu-Ala-Asp) box polypeptide 6 (DDX6), mRNA, RefSeq: NM_004397.3 n=1 Tax=Macaca fascicularis TaxID=9541 RepID=I7G7Y3_MACFA|nr:unnamed protein product [Macaca fascicularis]
MISEMAYAAILFALICLPEVLIYKL